MEEPAAKKDLVESILELRAECDRRLMRNKYYVAIKKLDELLEAIRPLEAEVSDENARGAMVAAEPTALTDETADVSVAHTYHEAVSEPQPQYAAASPETGIAQEYQATEDEPQAKFVAESTDTGIAQEYHTAEDEPEAQFVAASPDTGLAHEYYAAESESRAQFAAADPDTSMAREAYEPAPSMFDEAAYEPSEPMQVAVPPEPVKTEPSVLDITEDTPAVEAGKVQPTADAAE